MPWSQRSGRTVKGPKKPKLPQVRGEVGTDQRVIEVRAKCRRRDVLAADKALHRPG